MAGSDIERFMKNIRVRLPGATDDAIQLEWFNTMDEFFRGSNVWQEDIDMAVPAGDPAGTIYYLTPTAPSLIDKLLWAFQKPDDPNQYRGPQLLGVAMSVPGEVVLQMQPSEEVTYRVTVSLTVQDPVQRDGYIQFPAWVLARYRSVLMDGLLGKMYSQPGKPWTNTQLAVLHLRKFMAGTAQARVDMTRNNVYKQQPWRFPGFAGGNQRGRSGRWGPPQ